jgi:phosphatidylserine decarboxylase
MNPQSGRVNESNNLGLVRTDSPEEKLIVRQISGAIARRIVCAAAEGQELTGGEKFGMIKFGSRTELYVPISSRDAGIGIPDDTQYAARNTQCEIKCLVQIGDKVKAGLTPLAEYKLRGAENAEKEN